MRISVLAATALACVWTAGGALAADPAAPAISPDEQAVYEAVLSSWLGKDHGRQLVDLELSPAPSKSDPEFGECAKGARFPAAAEGQAGKSLAGVQFKRDGIELIDGSKWKPLDPGQGIREGKSVDAAVGEGVAHSLMSFSQIAFSQDRKDAIVNFGMVCGSLCGTGSTLRLHRSGERWTVAKRCGGWIS